MVDTAPPRARDPELPTPADRVAVGTPRWAWVVGGVLALLPVARMGRLVLRAHPLPYNDYWPMMDSLLTADGGFRAAGLFELRNEHPLVVAKLLYWINLQVTGGSNIALGLVVIAIALGQLAVVAVLARDLGRGWSLAPPLVVVAAAYLLFARQGAWHFVKSMSGAAWLSANLFALLAVWAQLRSRQVLAITGAVLATLSYGTGLVTWPVLLVVGALSGARPRRLIPVLGFGIAAAVWLQVVLADVGKTAADRPRLTVMAARGAEVVGAFLVPGRRVTAIRVGEALVAAGLVGAAIVVHRRVRHSDDSSLAAPWAGLLAYGAGMGLLVAAGRNTVLWSGTAGRYSAIGALTCLGVVGLAASPLVRRPGAVTALRTGAAGLTAVLCVSVTLGGAREEERLEASYAVQDLLSVGLEARLVDGSRLWLGDIEQLQAEDIEARLAAAGHATSLDDAIDCGLLGTTIEPGVATELPAGVRAAVVRLEDAGKSVPRGMVFDGWVEGAQVDCALLVDPQGVVVGAGGHGPARRGYGGPRAADVEGRVWFSGLAPRTAGATVHVRLDGYEETFALPPPG